MAGPLTAIEHGPLRGLLGGLINTKLIFHFNETSKAERTAVRLACLSGVRSCAVLWAFARLVPSAACGLSLCSSFSLSLLLILGWSGGWGFMGT